MNLKIDITEEEEIEIWKAYRNKPTLEIRDFFLIKYAPLVKYVAGKIINNGSKGNVEFDDLVSYGTLGLLDAISKFDPCKDTKFKTYAITRIRGQMFDELRTLDWVPRSVRQKHKLIEEIRINYKEKHGTMVPDEQIAKEIGISISEVERISNMSNDSNIGSLDDVWNMKKENEEISIIDTLKSPESMDPYFKIEWNEIQKRISQEIKKLPLKEQEVLILYYHEDLTLKEIGEVLEVTESRVSQLHGKAIRTVRSSLEKLNKIF